MSLPELPELRDLIPRIEGSVYNYAGSTYLRPVDLSITANKVPDHGVVRCGFRLYEVLEWSTHQAAWRVRQFKATLNNQELMQLSGQHDA